MWEQLFAFFKENWQIVKDHMRVFVTGAAIMLTVGYSMGYWWHSSALTGKDATIESLNTMVALQEKKVAALSEQVASWPNDQTALSALSNSQLRAASLGIVDGIRSALAAHQESTNLSLNRPPSGTTREARDADWYARIAESSQASEHLMNTYATKYMVSAILHREALLRRLPSDQTIQPATFHDYERPVNPLGVEQVVIHLETLARQLPDDPVPATE